MRLKKIVATAFLASGMLMLAACASKHKNSSDDLAMNDANNANGGAQTAALDQNGNFGGESEDGQKMASSKNTYYFDFDKSDIRDSDKPSIMAHANKLSSNPHKKIIVEGHTDPRGSREYNVALGEHRANAVSDLLQSNGAGSDQVRVVSYGAERLASTGRSESDYQQDRRAVIASHTN